MPKNNTVGPVKPPLDTVGNPTHRFVRNALKELDWSPMPGHPGTFKRWYQLAGIIYEEKCWCCADCAAEWPVVFHMAPDVWDGIASPNDTLCLICAAKRLGRPLRPDDLPAGASVNRELRYLLATREPK